jgi:antitoxin ParD1/3/4
MATIAKISVALPPEMVSLVRDVVDAGEYASSSDMEEVRRLWNDGIASGPGRAVKFADIKRKARARLERKK